MRGLQMVFFIGAELLVGALLLLALTSFIFNSFTDSEEVAIAKDLGLSIMAVASSPYDLRYHYSPGNERLFIELTEEGRAVRVSSPTGYGVYTFKPMHNVEIIKSDIGRVLSVPIFFQNNKIFFEAPEDEQSFFDCKSIISRFPDNPEVYFYSRYASEEEQKRLEELKEIIAGLISKRDNTGFSLAETAGSADIRIALEFSGKNYSLESIYYESGINANYQKISCNTIKLFSEDEDVLFVEFSQRPDRANERLLLRIGTPETISEGVLARYGNTIIKAISESIK